MSSKIKDIPRFKNEAEEREFWEREDSSYRVDGSQAERITFSNPTAARRNSRIGFGEHLIDCLIS